MAADLPYLDRAALLFTSAAALGTTQNDAAVASNAAMDAAVHRARPRLGR